MSPRDNNRSLRHLFVRPRQQIRLALLVFAVTIAGYTALIAFSCTSLILTIGDLSTSYGLPPEVTLLLSSAVYKSAVSIAILGFLLVIIMVILAVRIGHRIYGPQVPLEALVRKLKGGEYEARGALRKNDEFSGLMHELNELAASLQAKTTNDRGMTLVETLIGVAIMGILALAMMSLFNSQMRMTNWTQFRGGREQLRQVLVGQFLTNPNNCACLFQGADEFRANQGGDGVTLSGPQPSAVGIYQFTEPGNCATASVPSPFISTSGVNGIKATSIQLTNIVPVSGSEYSGHFQIGVSSLKEMAGPSTVQPIDVPVSITTTAASSGNVKFKSCSITSASADARLLSPKCVWVNGTCAPPACPAGFTDAGIISNELTALDRPYNGGNNARFCYQGTGHRLDVKCSWVNSSCTPATCPTGFIEVGVAFNELTAISKPYNGGNTVRTCVN